MSLCPICRKAYCDHTPEQRGQTIEEMHAPLTPAEKEEWEGRQAEDAITAIFEDPRFGFYVDWETMGDRIEGPERVLDRLPDGTFRVHSK